MDSPDLMKLSEFLTRYSIGRTTLYREVAANRLKLRKLGTATRIARTDAEDWANNLPVREGKAACTRAPETIVPRSACQPPRDVASL